MSQIYKVKSFAQYEKSMKDYAIAKNSIYNNFNVGSRVLTLIEAVALTLTKDSSDYYVALKKAIPIAMYTIFEFSKKDGVKSVGSLDFYKNEPAVTARPIPIGTKLLLGEVEYETIASGQINVGNTNSGNIATRAVNVGLIGNIGIEDIDTKNGLGTILSTPNGVEFAINNEVFASGTNSESNQQQRERFQTFINGLAKSNHNGVLTGLNTIDGLISFFVKTNFPGTGVVAVFAEDSPGNLTITKKNEIIKVLEGDANDLENFPGYIALGLSLAVFPPIVVPVTRTYTVVVKDTSDLAFDIDLQNAFLADLQDATETKINTTKIGVDIIEVDMTTFIKNFDDEVHDVLTSGGNIVVADEEVPRTGGSTGGIITLNIAVTSIY